MNAKPVYRLVDMDGIFKFKNHLYKTEWPWDTKVEIRPTKLFRVNRSIRVKPEFEATDLTLTPMDNQEVKP